MPRKINKMVPHGLDTPDENKAALREEVEKQVKAFLKKGGKIRQCGHGETADANLSSYRKGQIKGVEKMNAKKREVENAETYSREPAQHPS